MHNVRAKYSTIKGDRTRQLFCPDNIFQFLDTHASASRKSDRTATHNAGNAGNAENAGNAGLPDEVSAIALAKEEASRVSNDGRSRVTPGAAGAATLPAQPARILSCLRG